MRKVRYIELGLGLICLLGVFSGGVAFSAQDAGLKLETPMQTNNQVQFTLNCESGVSYVIERSVDMQNWTPVLTNKDSSIARAITIDAPDDIAFYRASRAPLPLFSAAIAAVSTINLQGNNVSTDSFDSGDTNYSNGGLYPAGIVSKTKANGDVCTDLALTNSLSMGNANIKGYVRTGPGVNTISIGFNGTVGDRAWVEGGNSGIKPGWSSTDFSVSFPDVVLPSTTWWPAPGSGTFDGVAYAHAFTTSRDYTIASLSGSTFVGTNVTARLKVLGNASFSSTNIIRICPGGRLTIYMQGSSFSMSGNSYVDNQTHHAENFCLYGLPTCTSVSLSSNGELDACIYAPSADYTLNSGGSSTTDFVGSSVTKTVTMNGHFNFHYDENLQRIGPAR